MAFLGPCKFVVGSIFEIGHNCFSLHSSPFTIHNWSFIGLLVICVGEKVSLNKPRVMFEFVCQVKKSLEYVMIFPLHLMEVLAIRYAELREIHFYNWSSVS